jgi:hypothetical protein
VWPIVVGVVVPVLVLITVGIVFVRGADPHAEADRDAANQALLTNHDLGGAFSEVEHRAFARARGGLRVEGGFAECAPSDNAVENDGQAVVDSVMQAQNGISAQVIAEEIIVMGSSDSATPLVDAMTATLRSCASAAMRDSVPGAVISLSPSAAPDIGNRAAAFHGSMGIAGGQLAADIDVLVVQQGRAVVLLMTVDTTGSLHGARLASLANTVLMRLVPRFGP